MSQNMMNFTCLWISFTIPTELKNSSSLIKSTQQFSLVCVWKNKYPCFITIYLFKIISDVLNAFNSSRKLNLKKQFPIYDCVIVVKRRGRKMFSNPWLMTIRIKTRRSSLVDNRPYTNLFHLLARGKILKESLHMTCDIWHMTDGMWHVTCDTWRVEEGEPSLKMSAL